MERDIVLHFRDFEINIRIQLWGIYHWYFQCHKTSRCRYLEPWIKYMLDPELVPGFLDICAHRCRLHVRKCSHDTRPPISSSIGPNCSWCKVDLSPFLFFLLRVVLHSVVEGRRWTEVRTPTKWFMYITQARQVSLHALYMHLMLNIVPMFILSVDWDWGGKKQPYTDDVTVFIHIWWSRADNRPCGSGHLLTITTNKHACTH